MYYVHVLTTMKGSWWWHQGRHRKVKAEGSAAPNIELHKYPVFRAVGSTISDQTCVMVWISLTHIII
jgi:hypothetical protein